MKELISAVDVKYFNSSDYKDVQIWLFDLNWLLFIQIMDCWGIVYK